MENEKTTSNARILVVDDLHDWRLTLTGMLRDAGYTVQTADCFDEAVTLLKTESFELAILDIRLDEMDTNNVDGLIFAEEIKRHWPQTKVLLLTGYATRELVSQAMEPNLSGESPVDGFLEKSELDHFPQAIEAVLR